MSVGKGGKGYIWSVHGMVSKAMKCQTHGTASSLI